MPLATSSAGRIPNPDGGLRSVPTRNVIFGATKSLYGGTRRWDERTVGKFSNVRKKAHVRLILIMGETASQ